jgi:osmotically-inducible protein OsmY
LCGLLVLAGCATERQAAGEYFDDAAITTRVKKAIYDEPSLKVTQIGVTTTDNVVHLTGTVKSHAEAAAAARAARKVEGVKAVKNDLKVKP